MVYKLL